jgi:hypothetical protein
VRVSRGAAVLSGFLVCVADSGESIELSSKAAERLPYVLYHSTPKGRARILAGSTGQNAEIQAVKGS